MSYTPGPWQVRLKSSDRDVIPGTTYYLSIITRANNLEGLDHLLMVDGDYHVCKFNPTKSIMAFEKMKIDATLIASAPELLEALELITDQLERVGDSRKDAPFIEAARLAISHAKGELNDIPVFGY